MQEINLLAAFFIGIAGSVHCVGMCGGLVTAFTFGMPVNANKQLFTLAYNCGRILSYTLVGTFTGYLGSIVSSANHTDFPILEYISIGFLILLALYISDLWKGLSYLERLGGLLWRRVQPLSKRFIPIKNTKHAFVYGMIWGYLPCGLVYSALTWSLASGSAVNGALLMLAFGLGTLPALLLISFGAKQLVPLLQHKVSRYVLALTLFSSAVFLLFR
ncbi:sulfite exporter TauE/SafE family protein [Agaribacter flavus]|uniref:Sulfite exporter TauE/SafE family protein n=1 Tax=Agaribacter flavus TaxID=1902781 RepID=A0ABV7FRF0_9ALTE